MPPIRYPVKLSTAWRAMYIGVGFMCLNMAASSAGADLKTQLLAWGFFGLGGVLVLKLMFRNSGSITLRDEGIVLDTHWSTGMIRWEHLQTPQAVRLLGMWHLGLSTTDPQAYLDSRQNLNGLLNETDRACTQGFFRGMIAMLTVLPAAKTFVNLALPLFGWAPLPKSSKEADMLAWQGENYGAQITIPRMWIPDFDRVLSELQHRAATHLRAEAPTAVLDEPQVISLESQRKAKKRDQKICPMCAEAVQQQARICRFCRYSFDEKRLLPSA